MNDVHLRSDSGLAQPAVVITGGTEGIGRALAELFAKDGNNLLLSRATRRSLPAPRPS